MVPICFQVITAVTTDNAVLWDVTPCSLEKARRFGGTYRLQLQDRCERKQETVRSGRQADTLYMDVIYSSETLGCLQITRRYGPEEHVLHQTI
jgi:hypothetical protein